MDDITLKNLMDYAKNTYRGEDLQQEFYLGALEGKGKYIPERGKLLTYLIRCGTNKVNNHIKHDNIYKENHKSVKNVGMFGSDGKWYSDDDILEVAQDNM
jgi:DNA-directed RNA polymerase specialized sigma24 family protein